MFQGFKVAKTYAGHAQPAAFFLLISFRGLAYGPKKSEPWSERDHLGSILSTIVGLAKGQDVCGARLPGDRRAA